MSKLVNRLGMNEDNYFLFSFFKVDREDHFYRPGFLQLWYVFSLGTKLQISLKNLDVTDV